MNTAPVAKTVAASTLAPLIRSLQESACDLNLWLAGLPLTLVQLEQPTTRIPLDVYHVLCERFAELLEAVPKKPSPTTHLSWEVWQRFLSESALIITLLNAEGIVLYANFPSPQISQAAIGQPIFKFIHQDHWQNVERDIQTVIARGRTVVSEIAIVDLDGKQQWYENRLTPLRENDKVVGIITASIDITERKVYAAELQKRAIQLQTVAKVSAQITSVLDFEQLIQNICDLVRDNFNLYHTHIYLLDEDTQRLVIKAGSGELGKRVVATRRSFPISNTTGLVVLAARERRPIVSNNVAEDPRFLFNTLLPDTASEMSLPILAGEKLIGVLDVQAKATDFFSEEDMRVQQTLANQIAIVLQNARRYEETRHQGQIAEAIRDIGMVLTENRSLQTVLKLALQGVANVLPFQAAVIWLRGTDGALQLATSIGYDKFGADARTAVMYNDENPTKLLEEMRRSLRPYIIPNTSQHPQWMPLAGFEWVKSAIGAPIIVRGQLVGQIFLDHSQAGFYRLDHMPIVEALIRQISLAVENAFLFEAEGRQRELAETMRDISIVLTSRLEQAEILQTVLSQVARVIPYHAAGIWLRDDEQGQLQLAAHVGYERYDLDKSLPAYVFLEDIDDKVTIFPLTEAESRWQVGPERRWIHSWAAAAIIERDSIIGYLVLEHSQPNFYQPHLYYATLEMLVTQLSIAVGNARLFEAERRRRQEIEALQRSSMGLTSSLELPAVLEAILQTTTDLLSIHDAYIFLYEDNKLRFAAGVRGRTEHVLDTHPSLPLPSPPLYTVAQTGEAVMLDDVRSAPSLRIMPPEWFTGFQAMLGMPLQIGGRVVGVMQLTFDTAADLNSTELYFVQLLVTQASIAIENARLYKTVQDHLALLETRVAERTIELERERAQLQVILDSMGEGVAYTENGQIRYINNTFAEITGRHPELGQTIPEFLGSLLIEEVPDKNSLQHMPAAIESHGGWRGDIRLRRGDGKEVDVSVIATVVRNSLGKPEGLVILLRDISQEKALQAQKDLFVTRASHELRTPLTNIKTRLYLIQMRPEKMPEHLRIIENVTEQMVSLVEDLLDLSRLERGGFNLKLDYTDLSDLMRNVVETQHPEAERKGLRLEINLPEQPFILLLDANRIQQVLTNLVINAITYTDEGGRITARVYAEGDRVIIEVEDTGVGIPSEMMPQVFEPFFRVREGSAPGTGLGLTISSEIVEAHGGSLSVTSEFGHGSCFRIALPLEMPTHKNTPLSETPPSDSA